MLEPRYDKSPYGPKYNSLWKWRHLLFSKFDLCRVDETGLYTMVPEKYAMEIATAIGGNRLLDIGSGIGSMSIAFARSGKRVTAVEVDERRVDMARHNAAVYGVGDRIDFRHGDITSPTVLETLPVDIDTIWIDPPWGSGISDYKKHRNLELDDLTLSQTALPKLVGRLPGDEVAIRVPFNFDITTIERPGMDILEFKKKAKTYFYVLRMTRDAFVDM